MNYNVAYNRRLRIRRRADGQCIDCGNVSPRLRCAECRGKQAAARSVRNNKRAEEGICTRCPGRRLPKRTMCGTCLDYYVGRKSRERDTVELMIVVAAVGA